jgi:hypothetical protein
VIKLCATCTERARDAKRAAEQKQAAVAAAMAASAAPGASATTTLGGSGSPALRKRERGMRYLEKVFPSHDRTVLSSTLEHHSLDFVAAGEALQRQQQQQQQPPSQQQSPPSVPPFIQPPPNATAGVPPPVPPWADAPPLPLPLPPGAPPRRALPNRERRATLREQFLLDAHHDGDDTGDDVGRVAQLRARLAEEQRVRADSRQLRDALVAKLERVKAQRNKLRDKLDSVARQVRWMQDEGALPPRDIERVKDQKRMLVRKLLELDEKHNKYIGMLRRVDADRARNDGVRAALQSEIAQLTDELERRAAEAERDAARQPAPAQIQRRDSLHNAVRQLRALSTLKVDKDGLVVVPSAPVAGAPLPPPRRGPLPSLPQRPHHSSRRACNAANFGGVVVACLPVAARSASPRRRSRAKSLHRICAAVCVARPPTRARRTLRPTSTSRISARRGVGRTATLICRWLLASTATACVWLAATCRRRATEACLAASGPIVSPPPALSPPPASAANARHPSAWQLQALRLLLWRLFLQQPQQQPSAARRLAFPTMPALASPFRVHTRPVGSGASGNTQPLRRHQQWQPP